MALVEDEFLDDNEEDLVDARRLRRKKRLPVLIRASSLLFNVTLGWCVKRVKKIGCGPMYFTLGVRPKVELVW